MMVQDNQSFSPSGSPLDEDDLERLREAEAELQRAREQIDLAKSANLDVSVQEERVATLAQQIRSLKATYFPGR